MEEPYNPDLWNSDLNEALYKAVIERVFDFSLIALDIRDYIIMSGIDKDFELYTRDQCRLHWSHIHALREEAINNEQNDDISTVAISEAPTEEEKKIEIHKEEIKEEIKKIEQPKNEEKKQDVKIPGKNNEIDFSKIQTTTIDGKVINPSSIFILKNH